MIITKIPNMCGSRLTHCINQGTMTDNEKPFWPPRRSLVKGVSINLKSGKLGSTKTWPASWVWACHFQTQPSIFNFLIYKMVWGRGVLNFSNSAELFKHFEMSWSLPWSKLKTSPPTVLSLYWFPVDCGGGTCWWLFCSHLAESVVLFHFSPLKETTGIREPESTLSS